MSAPTDVSAGVLVAVALAGGLGAAARFVIDGLLRSRSEHVLPVATIVVNVSGSLVIGLLNGAALWHGFGSTWLVVTATGFCGGYTTFSTAMVETVRLARSDEWRLAVANAVGTLLLCVAAASAGVGLMWATR